MTAPPERVPGRDTSVRRRRGASRSARRRVAARALFAAFAELLALCGLAIAQPVLDVFGAAPEVFAEAGAGRADLWWFALAVAFAPPVLLVAIEVAVAVAAGDAARRGAHLCFVAALVLLFGVRLVRLAVGAEGVALLVAALVIMAALVIAQARVEGVRRWLRYVAIAPLVFVALFLFGSEASSLATGADGRADDAVTVDTGKAAATRPPVVLLILDELPVRSLLAPDGSIDSERFPGFGALARDSTWYRNTTSVGTHTVHAVPAIFTGQYPTARDLPATAAAHPDSLYRLLGNAYRFNVSELITQLCAVPRCAPDHAENAPRVDTPDTDGDIVRPAVIRRSPLRRLLDRARDAYPDMVALHDIEVQQVVERDELTTVPSTTTPTTFDGPVDPSEATPTSVNRGFDLLASVQPARLTNWLDRIDADIERPQLSVLHLTLPHGPFFIDGAGVVYEIPTDNLQLVGSDFNRWVREPGAARSARQRHLLQSRYVDSLVASLQQRLSEIGIWDDSVVIVTADHGAGFEPGEGFRAYTGDNGEDLMGVPLFVHGPGFTPGVIEDDAAQLVDIVPTIADVAHVGIPWRIDGLSLRDLPATRRAQHPYSTLNDFEYGFITVDVSDHLQRLLASAAANRDVGGDDMTILRSGPSGVLIGTRLDDASGGAPTLGASSDLGLVLDFPTAGSFAPNDRNEVRAFIVGHLERGAGGATVVIAVDGRIAATALTFSDRREPARFAALLPPSWMRGGDHDVEFFVLDDDTLRALEVS